MATRCFDGLAEMGQHPPDTAGVAADRRVLGIGVRQQLGLGRQGQVGQDHLDVQGREHHATATVHAEREVLPVQIGDSEPAPERERTADDRGEPAPAVVRRPRQRLQREPLHLAAGSPPWPEEFEPGQEAERFAAEPIPVGRLFEEPPERAVGRQHQPLPEERAGLGEPPGAHGDTAPEVVKVAEVYRLMKRSP
jgi:hypothetical protein